MIPRPLRSFVERLHDATDKREVVWQESNNNVHFCNRKDITVFLQRYFDEDALESSYHMRLVRSGNEDAPFQVTDGEADYALMRDLHSSVLVNSANFTNIEDDFFA
jgi:hypothetical protein